MERQVVFADFDMDMKYMDLKKRSAEQDVLFGAIREVPNAVTAKAIADSESGNDVYGSFDSVEALMEALNA